MTCFTFVRRGILHIQPATTYTTEFGGNRVAGPNTQNFSVAKKKNKFLKNFSFNHLYNVTFKIEFNWLQEIASNFEKSYIIRHFSLATLKFLGSLGSLTLKTVGQDIYILTMAKTQYISLKSQGTEVSGKCTYFIYRLFFL